MLYLLHRLGNGVGIVFFVGLTFLTLHRAEGKAFPNSHDTTQNTEREDSNSYSAVAVGLLNNATRIEGFTTNFFNPISLEVRTSLAEHRSRSRITEVFFKTSFVQYTNVAINIRVNYRKSDLIFPFHYYW